MRDLKIDILTMLKVRPMTLSTITAILSDHKSGDITRALWQLEGTGRVKKIGHDFRLK